MILLYIIFCFKQILSLDCVFFSTINERNLLNERIFNFIWLFELKNEKNGDNVENEKRPKNSIENLKNCNEDVYP